MQDAQKRHGRSKVKLLATLSAAFTWVAFGPILILDLALRFPFLSFVCFPAWILGLSMDFYTTYRFYMADPENFRENESSGYMRRLYRAFGFKAGLLAFLTFIELPVMGVISFLLIPASARVFNVQYFALDKCLLSGLAFHGVQHSSAAVWNFLMELKEKQLHSYTF